MKSRKRNQRGFTLIEVLIVVVIIGVLAALIIPRFVSAPEKAIVAEANQMLGSLIRAEQAVSDLGGTWIGAGTLTTANWTSLGMTIPSASKFTYSCSGTACSAFRSAANIGASTASVDSGTMAWTCNGGYTKLANGGCTVA